MSGVVLRCPNCGTTRATEGRCDACHEADVRYFCTNHSPGHWLTAPTCPDCGARFGETAPRVPPAPTRERGERTPSRGSRSKRVREAAPPPEESFSSPWRDEDPTPTVIKGSDSRRKAAIREAVLARLPELLRSTRGRPRLPDGVSPLPDPAYGHPIEGGVAVGGCLLRAMVLGFFLLMALFFGALLLGGSLLQGFGVVVF